MANMRRVSMLTKPDELPYKDAHIELETLHTNEIAPAQRYVLTQEILKVRDLRWALREHDVDLFELDGYVTIWLEGYDDPIDVLPPVVEQSAEADSSVVQHSQRRHAPGLSRADGAVPDPGGLRQRTCRSSIPITHSRSSTAGTTWRSCRELPEGYIKKWHRIKDYKSLYRNFNSGFQNVGGPRGNFTNAGK